MLGQEREHTAGRDQLPTGLPHIRPDHLPGPFTLHTYKTGPDSTEPGPEPEIFSSLLGVLSGWACCPGPRGEG
ncbi:hypothetical protein TPA0910_51020 [Streptomyces hygroscopicus subsp. sporocinereus]|uniref:Uncharacterized protein n=1 Tax=Streptomyces hygroscopicus TaxID=1912 RepID=A0ABQ3U4Y5_STRHY|nr:hypothetical protein TPA0910_51020 [Streptomyces hygroscopicus]